MKAIIFGISGQDGFYLKQILENNKIKVFGTGSKMSNNYDFVDLSNFQNVFNYIENINPDYIFCFSAISNTSHLNLFKNHKIISLGTLNILESIRILDINCRIFIPGSAVQFRLSNSPIDENSSQYPNSPYATERIYTLNLAKYFREKFRLKVYYGFLFHHDSPYRKDDHLTIKIIKKIKKIKDEGVNKLVINNLNYTKEFNHAKDIVNAIWIFINQDKVYEIVIGSGLAISIDEFIKKVIKEFNFDCNFKFGHYGEKEVITCNPSQIKEMGWIPKFTTEELIKDIITNGNIS